MGMSPTDEDLVVLAKHLAIRIAVAADQPILERRGIFDALTVGLDDADRAEVSAIAIAAMSGYVKAGLLQSSPEQLREYYAWLAREMDALPPAWQAEER